MNNKNKEIHCLNNSLNVNDPSQNYWIKCNLEEKYILSYCIKIRLGKG